MKILLDVSSFEIHKSENRGIYRYVLSVINGLKTDPSIEIDYWNGFATSKDKDYDIFIITDLMSIYPGIDNPLLVPVKTKRKMCIIYDWIAQSYYVNSFLQRQLESRLAMLKGGVEVLTISDFMVNFLKSRNISAINIGCEIDIDVMDSFDLKFQKNNLILTIGGIDSHKNTFNQNLAIEIAKSENSQIKHAHIGSISPMAVYPNCIWVKCRNDNEKINWLRHAKCLLYSSIYEGFGIPPLEALNEKCIPIVSDISIFHETLKHRCVRCDPLRPIDMADKILSAINSYDEVFNKIKFNNINDAIAFYSRYQHGTVGKKLIEIINKA